MSALETENEVVGVVPFCGVWCLLVGVNTTKLSVCSVDDTILCFAFDGTFCKVSDNIKHCCYFCNIQASAVYPTYSCVKVICIIHMIIILLFLLLCVLM